MLAALFFVLGLSTVFLLLGLAASAFGAFFLGNASTFATLAGVVVMIFGAHFLGIYRIGFLDREMRLDAGDHGGSAFGAYVLGLAFAFGWTPCIGPQLGAILSLAAQEGNVGARHDAAWRSMPRVWAFRSCWSRPSSPRLAPFVSFMKRHAERIEKIMGLLLWTIGLLMLTGGFSSFSYWLLENMPFLAGLGLTSSP